MGDSPALIYLPHYTDPFIEDLFTQFAGLAYAVLHNLPSFYNQLSFRKEKYARKSHVCPFPVGPITDGSFLTEQPVEAFQNGNFIKVPVLFGSNTNEGANWSAELDDPNANTSSPNATEMTVYNFIAGQYPTFTQESFQTAITEFYPLVDYNGSFSLQGQQMYGEMRYICSAVMVTGALQDAGMDAYQYRWDNPTLGSDHADELDVFFNGDEVFDPTDQALVEAMRSYWTSFVTSGQPVAESSIEWTPATDNDGSPRILLHPGDVVLEDVSDALSERCAFWHSISSELAT
ncbi:Alpha/Beta hydrolase protein [Mycena sp. CBHHK59/15]|nr:Alpha/Beta hydrolase protein [Mycena sp. CBHHK59/15]